MFAALGLLLPLSLGGAVSPMMLTEQTILLGAGGRRAANHYALGAVITLLVIVVVLVFAGHLIELPTEPTLSATLDIVLGVALTAAGAGVQLIGARRSRAREDDAVLASSGPGASRSLASRPEAAFPFGVFSMATNFTTLALVVVAAKEIAAGDLNTLERIVLIAVVVAICSTPAWAPLAATKLAPKTGQRVLEAFRRFIDAHGRTSVVVLLLGAGAFLLARGILNL